MIGNDRIRYCSQCQLNVYNLSAMTKGEAEDLIIQKEGRLCVRYYQRKDGTILTRNCPVGLRAIKQRINKVTVAVFSACLSFAAGLGLSVKFSNEWLANKLIDNKFPSVMGDVASREIHPTLGKLSLAEEKTIVEIMGTPIAPQKKSKRKIKRAFD